MKLLHEELTSEIIKCFYEVHNELGYGFLEKVYENSLKKELTSKGFNVESQKEIEVYYKKEIVGQYFADLIVNRKVIIEIKAISSLAKIHEVQLVNYLKATEIKVGLLVNFGKKIEFKRKVF